MSSGIWDGGMWWWYQRRHGSYAPTPQTLSDPKGDAAATRRSQVGNQTNAGIIIMPPIVWRRRRRTARLDGTMMMIVRYLMLCRGWCWCVGACACVCLCYGYIMHTAHSSRARLSWQTLYTWYVTGYLLGRAHVFAHHTHTHRHTTRLIRNLSTTFSHTHTNTERNRDAPRAHLIMALCIMLELNPHLN